MAIDFYIFIASSLLLLSIFCSKATGRMGIPALLMFIGIGMLGGSEGLGGIQFNNYFVAQSIGIIALILILFEGGLESNWLQLRDVAAYSISLSTVGVFVTAISVGVFASYAFNLSLLEGALLGSIISSTDAAAVFGILRAKGTRLKGALQPILEFESGSNDPMAIFLTSGLMTLIQQPESPIFSLVILFFKQFIIGGCLGILGGRALLWMINRIRLGFEGLYAAFSLSCVLLIYSLTAVLEGSGFLAVYLVGIMLSSRSFAHKNSLIRFYSSVAWLAQISIFLTLGLLVYPSHLIPVLLEGLALTCFLIFIARPLSIFCSIPLGKLSIKEKMFISWVGLRGATPIILATFPLLANIPHAEELFNCVFFVVLISVLIQGSFIPTLAHYLKLIDPTPSKKKPPLEFYSDENLDTRLHQIHIDAHSPILGKEISQLPLPKEALVVLITRGSQLIIPRGTTRLEVDDTILVLALDDLEIETLLTSKLQPQA